MSRCRKSFIVSLSVAALAAGGFVTVSHAAPPITVTSQVPVDGPIQYTVKVSSKAFGDAQDTRTIRSGQTDDFTWKTVPPSGPVAIDQKCPNYGSVPLDANGAMIRQTQVRLAPVVAADGTANVQLNFQASAPRNGTKLVKVGDKRVQCPNSASFSQVLRLTMPTNGSAKTFKLSDGSQVTISARR